MRALKVLRNADTKDPKLRHHFEVRLGTSWKEAMDSGAESLPH